MLISINGNEYDSNDENIQKVLQEAYIDLHELRYFPRSHGIFRRLLLLITLRYIIIFEELDWTQPK